MLLFLVIPIHTSFKFLFIIHHEVKHGLKQK
uniref:Uncharacterized protein n=1 Tax=Anguilla anguilla TaxID=7936 RepID=A0A0E9VQZ3_ANGAN